MPHSRDSEQELENATLRLFEQLGWQTVNCFDEVYGDTPATPGHPNLGRETRGEVVLVARLRDALRRLNPDLSDDAIQQAIDELTRDRSLVTAAQANREMYSLLKDGVKVTASTPALPHDDEARRRGGGEVVTARVIDWNTPGNNDFLIASQLWVTGPMYTRRTDLIGFVNGLPLLFVELKAAHR